VKYARLADTELVCSVVGFGGFAIGGTDWYGTTEETSREAIITAYEEGVNFFDTSSAYGWGRSEELLGEILGPRRDEVLLATKAGVVNEGRDFGEKSFQPAFLGRSLDESLRRLRTDYVDLFLLHSPCPEDLTEEIERFLEEIVRQGKARYTGVSISSERSGLRALELTSSHALEIYFNVFEQSLRQRLFPRAQHQRVGLIGRVPLYSGLLSGRYSPGTVFPPTDHRSRWDPTLVETLLKRVEELTHRFVTPARGLAQVALAFVLAQEEITVAIPGAKDAAQVRSNVAAADIVLSDDDALTMRCMGEELNAR
jgi:aryl-alcohol dehydrogenase-like predicted oxidoreductase